VKRARGLSLLEVQLALMLLLIAVLTAVAMTPTGLRSVEQAQRSTNVVGYYARHLLESTLALEFNRQASVVSTKLEETIASAPPNTYTYTIDVATLPTNAEVHTVQVTLNWSDEDGNGNAIPRSVKLVGYSARLDE
jgi:Tfp pilus assembly protein PilV